MTDLAAFPHQMTADLVRDTDDDRVCALAAYARSAYAASASMPTTRSRRAPSCDWKPK